MFTGIIQEQGRIMEVRPHVSGGKIFVVSAPGFFRDGKKGESIAVNGVCVTALTIAPDTFSFETMPETLRLTTFAEASVSDVVNLERSLRVGDSLGGHFLLGHVDGVASVADIVADGDYVRVVVNVPAPYRKFLAYKGTVALNGVSLTVAEVTEEGCVVALISHTREVTNLGALKPTSRLNLEVDMMARYLERLQHLPVAGTIS